MNIKDEHTSRLWTFILKGEIMDLDDEIWKDIKRI